MPGPTDLTIVAVTTITVPGEYFNAMGTLAPIADAVQNLNANAVMAIGSYFPDGTQVKLDTQITGGFVGSIDAVDLTPTDPEVAAEG